MSASLLPAVVELRALGALPDKPMAQGGQCEGIWEVLQFPGLLYKQYTDEVRQATDPVLLDRLIDLPNGMTAEDQALVRTAMAWPTGRVIDDWGTAGVLMPRVPASFSVTWYSPRARRDAERHQPLEIDVLAKPSSYLEERRIPSQSTADRIRVCTTLARFGELFERHGIVYADWSYSNAFWHPVRHAVFLLDVDGCSFGPRPHVITPNFDDPLTPFGAKVDNWTDRYRAALLLGRCLTARREVHEVVDALRGMSGAVPDTLLRMITAGTRTERPPLTELAAAFGDAPRAAGHAAPVDGTGVVTWRKVRKLPSSGNGASPADTPRTASGGSSPPDAATNGATRVRPPRQPTATGRRTPPGGTGTATAGPARSGSGSTRPPGRGGPAPSNSRQTRSGPPQPSPPSTVSVVVGLLLVLPVAAGVIWCGISVISAIFK